MATHGAKKVVFNTGILYTKLLIQLVVGLFTTRLVLNSLGKTDYGIYALVAGVIGMFGVLNVSMSLASMRFMAHSLGSGNEERIKKTFNSALIIHFILAFIVVIVMEVGGLLAFQHLLNIPADRLYDAKIVFHFMVASTFVAVISVPFDAVIFAHENFLALSVADVIGAVIGLAIAIYIAHLSSNLLIVYAFLVFLNQVVLRIIKQWYSRVKYEECRIRLKEYIDKNIIRSIFSFAGWQMLNASGAIIIVQGKSILLNMFFGVPLNAANGVTTSLTGSLNQVSVNMTQSMKPRIMKSEGGGNREKMLRLTTTTAKFSVFLFTLFAIPVLIETPYLLTLWLKNVPEYTVIFCRLLLFTMIVEKFTFDITTAISAVGKIKMLTIVELILILLTLPVSYFLFKQGLPPQTIYLVGLADSLFIATGRLYWGWKIAGLNIKSYLYTVFFRGTLPLVFAVGFALIPFIFMDESFTRLILTVFVSMFSTIILIRYLGLTNEEYVRIRSMVVEGITKVRLLTAKKTSLRNT